MSETTQNSVDYENSSELGFDLSENDWQNLADEAEFDETNRALIGQPGVEDSENLSYTLSKQDFQKYFEGEDFQQENVGDCRLLSGIDSLVSFGDYEKLIRTSVIKNNNGFTIYLPLGAPSTIRHGYSVSFDELAITQRDMYGDPTILVTGKQGIQALVLAYGKMSTGKNGQFDYNNLSSGNCGRVFNDLIYGINVYHACRKVKSENEDPDGTYDKRFINKLYKTLESFDSRYDMMALSVNQIDEIEFLLRDLPGEAYSSLGHYSENNHEISVEKVRKENGTLIVTVSNPRDSNRTYDITFDNLIKSCRQFFLGTKKERPGLKRYNKSYKGGRASAASNYTDDFGDVYSVNQDVQLTGKANEALRAARGDILVTDMENDTLKVSSYGLDMGIKERDGLIIIYNDGIELSINKSYLSQKYEYKGETFEDDCYPLYLYGAKIANFINMMRKCYINPKKWDKNNNKPFCLINGSLQFDDNPDTFEGLDKVKRKGGELMGDDYIECLNDWDSLGINPGDSVTKQKIVNFLNQLVKQKK